MNNCKERVKNLEIAKERWFNKYEKLQEQYRKIAVKLKFSQKQIESWQEAAVRQRWGDPEFVSPSYLDETKRVYDERLSKVLQNVDNMENELKEFRDFVRSKMEVLRIVEFLFLDEDEAQELGKDEIQELGSFRDVYENHRNRDERTPLEFVKNLIKERDELEDGLRKYKRRALESERKVDGLNYARELRDS